MQKAPILHSMGAFLYSETVSTGLALFNSANSLIILLIKGCETLKAFHLAQR